MPYRRSPLTEQKVYHVFTKSIAGYKIFNSQNDYKRIVESLVYYRRESPPGKFSHYLEATKNDRESIFRYFKSDEKIVRVIAYCIMPTHIHLVLEQLRQDGISKYMNLVLKSYSGYFNIKYKRRGPLWETRFKNIIVEADEQLLHLTRYLHLNPVTAGIIDRPEDWQFSSYGEYLGVITKDDGLCDYKNFFDIDSNSYRKFVEDQIGYQRELAIIKKLLIE